MRQHLCIKLPLEMRRNEQVQANRLRVIYKQCNMQYYAPLIDHIVLMLCVCDTQIMFKHFFSARLGLSVSAQSR